MQKILIVEDDLHRISILIPHRMLSGLLTSLHKSCP